MCDFYIENDTRTDSPHKSLLELIPKGKRNAVSVEDLAEKMELSQKETIWKIRYAQIDENIIAVTDSGVFIPSSLGELREYIIFEMGRITFEIEALNNAHRLYNGERLTMVYKGEDYEE